MHLLRLRQIVQVFTEIPSLLNHEVKTVAVILIDKLILIL